MALIWIFYMNSVVGFGIFFPNLMEINNINRSKCFNLKYSAMPILKYSKYKFQLKILLSKFTNYRRRKHQVLAIFPVALCQHFSLPACSTLISGKWLLSPLYNFCRDCKFHHSSHGMLTCETWHYASLLVVLVPFNCTLFYSSFPCFQFCFISRSIL